MRKLSSDIEFGYGSCSSKFNRRRKTWQARFALLYFFFPSLAKDKSIGCAKKRKYLLKKTSAKSWKLQRLLTNKWVWDFWRRQTWKDKSINNRLKLTTKKYVYSDTTLKEMILKILTVYVYILNASLNTSFRI